LSNFVYYRRKVDQPDAWKEDGRYDGCSRATGEVIALVHDGQEEARATGGAWSEIDRPNS